MLKLNLRSKAFKIFTQTSKLRETTSKTIYFIYSFYLKGLNTQNIRASEGWKGPRRQQIDPQEANMRFRIPVELCVLTATAC